MNKSRGMAIKSGDETCVPLCHSCHMRLHDAGDESLYWALSGVDPEKWAKETFANYNQKKL